MVTLQSTLPSCEGKLGLVSAPVVTPSSIPPAPTWPMPSMGVGWQLGSLGQLPGIRPWEWLTLDLLGTLLLTALATEPRPAEPWARAPSVLPSLIPSATSAQSLSQLVTSRLSSLELADIWWPDPAC